MTLPAFGAAGTGTTGDPSWPSHSTGHLGLLFVESSGANPVDTPSGWTVITGFPVVTPSTRLSGFYKFAASGSETAPTVTGTSLDHTWAVIVTYTGVNALNPFHLVATSISNSTTRKGWPGLTTYLADCMIVNVLAWQIDNAGPLGSGEVNADLGSLTERYDAGTISGDGGGLYINDGTKAARGSFTFTEVTFSSAVVAGFATIALQAADQTFGLKSRIINTRM